MKNKTMYYLSPFWVLPLVCLLSVGLAEILSVLEYIRLMKYVFPLLLLIAAVGIARHTATRGSVDWMITLLIPLAFFLTMFFANFFDAGETYARLDAVYALRASVRPENLWICLMLIIAACIASSRKCRKRRRRYG